MGRIVTGSSVVVVVVGGSGVEVFGFGFSALCLLACLSSVGFASGFCLLTRFPFETFDAMRDLSVCPPAAGR